MILAVCAANERITFGTFDDGKLTLRFEIAASTALSADETALKISGLLNLYGRNIKEIEGIAVTSVAPRLVGLLREAVSKLSDAKFLCVGPGVKNGLNIKIDNPAELGSNNVCDAVAAIKKYSAPCIIMNFGAATVVSVIDKNRIYKGGAIIPGLGISKRSLENMTEQLPVVPIEKDAYYNVLSGSTKSCMQSGIVYSAAAVTDSFAERYREIVGENAEVIVTGHYASFITKYCKTDVITDDNLTLEGLYLIFEKNIELPKNK
ncbi:MAG: type III pantothenate kinase [Ruminococcus sp.]|jgi:type III pantothenate kinase|nr:type III pantothenate kinase [Ruminococcus sp.]